MFAKPTLQELIAENDAIYARVMAQFDDIDAMAARIKAQMVADGLIRDPQVRERATDQQTAA